MNLAVKPGEVAIFDYRLAHASYPNSSDDRRIGVGIRYIPPETRQILRPWDSATLVRGEDRFGHFELEPRPRFDFDPEAVEIHKRADAAQRARVALRGERGRVCSAAGEAMPRGTVLEQRTVHQRPRREHARHIALDHTLGVLRELRLLADRDAKPLVDQFLEVGLELMMRHPCHRNARRALRQREPDRFAHRDRVIIEHLVKIADPKQQNAALVPLLEAVILLHRGCFTRVGHTSE